METMGGGAVRSPRGVEKRPAEQLGGFGELERGPKASGAVAERGAGGGEKGEQGGVVEGCRRVGAAGARQGGSGHGAVLGAWGGAGPVRPGSRRGGGVSAARGGCTRGGVRSAEQDQPTWSVGAGGSSFVELDDVDADRFRIREIRVRHAFPHVRALRCRWLRSARQTMHAWMGASSISAWRAACSISCSHGPHTDQAVPALPAFSTITPRQRLQRRRRPAVRSSSATASRTVRASVAIVSAGRRGRRRRAR